MLSIHISITRDASGEILAGVVVKHLTCVGGRSMIVVKLDSSDNILVNASTKERRRIEFIGLTSRYGEPNIEVGTAVNIYEVTSEELDSGEISISSLHSLDRGGIDRLTQSTNESELI